MWEKEKLLVTSNFSFSHSVFKRLVLQTCKNQQSFFGERVKCVKISVAIFSTAEGGYRFQRKTCIIHRLLFMLISKDQPPVSGDVF